MSATLTTIMAASTATPTVVLHTRAEIDPGEAKYYLELLGMVTATIAGIVVGVELAPVVVRGIGALSRRIRERRERRRAAEDEENAIELAAWSASGVASGGESGNVSQGAVWVAADSCNGDKSN